MSAIEKNCVTAVSATRNLITLNAIEILIRQGKISSSSRQILETVIMYIQNTVLDSFYTAKLRH